MPKTLTETQYLVVRPGDRGYETLQDHFPDLPNDTVYTVVSDTLPDDLAITPQSYIVARYYLDEIMADQDCVATSDGKVNANVFFEGFNKVAGIQRVHALAHLILAVVGDYTDESHVTDRFFSKDGRFYLAFSVELNLDKLHSLIERIWPDLNNLLTKGVVQGYVKKLHSISR